MEKLNKDKLAQLLEKADDKWFLANPLKFDYHKHLGFVAEYLAKHYNTNNRGKRRVKK